MANLAITASQVVPVSIQGRTAIAGVALTAGQNVYVDTSGLLQKTDTSTAVKSGFGATAMGICMETSVSAGQPAVYATTGDTVDLGADAAAVCGASYWVSDTAGSLADAGDAGTGDWVTFACIGIGSNQVLVTEIPYDIQHA